MPNFKAKAITQMIETSEDAAKNLAKFLSKSTEKERLYHGTGDDISEFRPSKIGALGPGNYLTKKPNEASEYSIVVRRGSANQPNVLPVYGQIKNPFIISSVNESNKELFKHFDPTGKLTDNEVIDLVKKAGYDSVFAAKEGEFNIFDPAKIKSAIGNRGTFDPTNPDITKAEGGQINPIKTPQQMLLEYAGIPHMAGGGTPKAKLLELVAKVIKDYKAIHNREPNKAEMEALAKQVQMMTEPTGFKPAGTPQAAARAKHELATDPNLIHPDIPDPFLSQATLGRRSNRTWLKPKTLDINDPNVIANIEAKQTEGLVDEGLFGSRQSVTPSTDALARTATELENRALLEGKIPVIEKLKLTFFKKHGRYPDEQEVEQLIAEYNPLRHQYGEKGLSIVNERPPTAKGMQDWVARARAEGLPESSITDTPRNYPKYIQDELAIGRGEQPGVNPMSEDLISNPDKPQFAGGGHASTAMTPDEMRAMMIAQGKTPSKLIPETRMEKIMRYAGAPAFAAMSAQTAKERLEEGDPYQAALYGTSALGNAAATSRKFMRPGFAVAGGAMVPLSIDEAINRYKKGDRTGAVISAIEAAGNAAAMYPPTAIPGTLISLGAGVANAVRGEPEYRSVMEDYK